MSNQPDRLNLLQMKYQEEIRNHRSKIEELTQKIALIEEVKADASTVNVNGLSINGRYAEMGLTAAATDALKEVASTEASAATTAQIKKYLLDNGFKPLGKNFTISLGQTLARLANKPKNKVKTALQGSNRVYWKAEPQYRVVSAA